MPCLQNSKYTASPVARRTDAEAEGNVYKFVAGKPFIMKVENKKFMKDSRRGLLAEATVYLFMKHAGSSEMRVYFISPVCSTALRKSSDPCLQG